MRYQLITSQRLMALKAKKTWLASPDIQSEPFFTRPLYPLRYDLPILPLPEIALNAIPMLFLEPLEAGFLNAGLSEAGFNAMLKPLENQTVLFVFETFAHLMHMLQFPKVFASLCMPHHLIYILEKYPNAQFAAQEIKLMLGKDFQPIFSIPRKPVEAALPVLLQGIKACIAQPEEMLKSDSETGNWLYRAAKRLVSGAEGERLEFPGRRHLKNTKR